MTAFPLATIAAHPRWDTDDRTRLAQHDLMDALGDEIVNRLFRAGFDLCSALGLAKDEPVRLRLEQAVEELDEAIKDLRHLMLIALAEPADPEISGT